MLLWKQQTEPSDNDHDDAVGGWSAACERLYDSKAMAVLHKPLYEMETNAVVCEYNGYVYSHGGRSLNVVHVTAGMREKALRNAASLERQCFELRLLAAGEILK